MNNMYLIQYSIYSSNLMLHLTFNNVFFYDSKKVVSANISWYAVN